MYCEQCGNMLEPQNRFCAKCGSIVAQASDNAATYREPAAPVAESVTSEPVIWVFSAQRKLSAFKLIPCSIVFMADKAVFAHLSPQLQKVENAKASQDIKAKGLGFFKGSAEMMQYWSNYHKKYYSMNIGEILSEDPTNFVLPYQNIKKVMYQCESSTIDSEGSTYGTQGKLNFDLFDGKPIKFSHSRSHDKSVKGTLTKLFGGKLKYKK